MSGDSIRRARIERDRLTMRCTVLVGQRWEDVARDDLPCAFMPANRLGSNTSAQRSELAQSGTLQWIADYTMPTAARIRIDAYPDVTWNLQRGTIMPEVGRQHERLFWSAEVTRILA